MSVNRTPTQPSCTYDRPVIVLYVIFQYTFLKQIELFFSLIISYSPALHKQNISRYNKKAPTKRKCFLSGGDTRIWTGESGFCRPMPYHLAMSPFWKRRLIISAFFFWSGRRGSNSLPPPWQGGALPDELRPHMVPPIGIEPMTRGFSVPCSTNWATEANVATRNGFEPSTSSVTG